LSRQYVEHCVGAVTEITTPRRLLMDDAKVSDTDSRRVLAEARRGSAEAVERLVGLCWPDAHRIAYLILRDREEAEDVAQEVMLSLVDRLGELDPGRRPEPWVKKVAANRAIDHVRRRRPAEELGAARPAPDVARSDGPVVAALATLEPEDRALIVLRHLLGYRSGEIGKQMGISAGAVRKRLKRAMDRLRWNLKEGGSDED